MEKNRYMQLLTKELCRIRNMGLVKNSRKGTTGVGYTFEALINKKEDQECKPDFGNIEIKCRFGYSKGDLSLFNCEPFRIGSIAKNYIFEKYSYHRYNNINDYRLFQRKLFANYSMCVNGYGFKLLVDYNKEKITMVSFKNNLFCEIVCSWDFKTLRDKLYTKLSMLAIVKAYPYKIDGDEYFKYVGINYYKLRSFNAFLKLIEEDKIYISIYIREGLNKLGDSIIENHGSCFRIKWNCLNELFQKIE
jgi:hypothetical protein